MPRQRVKPLTIEEYLSKRLKDRLELEKKAVRTTTDVSRPFLYVGSSHWLVGDWAIAWFARIFGPQDNSGQMSKKIQVEYYVEARRKDLKLFLDLVLDYAKYINKYQDPEIAVEFLSIPIPLAKFVRRRLPKNFVAWEGLDMLSVATRDIRSLFEGGFLGDSAHASFLIPLKEIWEWDKPTVIEARVASKDDGSYRQILAVVLGYEEYVASLTGKRPSITLQLVPPPE